MQDRTRSVLILSQFRASSCRGPRFPGAEFARVLYQHISRMCWIVLILLIGGLLFSFAAAAESGWQPWSREEPAFRSDIGQPQFYGGRIAERSGLTSGDIESMLNKMAAIQAVFQRVPVLDPPQGLRIESHRHILPRHDQTGRAQAILWLPIYEERSSHFGSQILVFVNVMLAGTSLVGEDDQGEIYLSPLSAGEVRGNPLYRLSDEGATALLIMNPDRVPWLPVSQERWIQSAIDSTRSQLDEYQIEALAKVEHAIENVEEMMATYRSWQDDPAMAGIFSPEQIEQMLQTSQRLKEELELEAQLVQTVVAALQAQDYDRVEDLSVSKRPLAMMGRTLLGLEEEMERLSSEERAAAAYGFELPAAMIHFPPLTPERTSLLLDPDDERARPLIAPNPDFYRSDLPATAIQSLAILQQAPATQSWQTLMEEIRQTIDLEALAALLE